MPKKILVVEDHADACEMLSLFFQSEGFEAICAHDGRQGFALALREQPDLLVTDIKMPNLDGIKMIKLLRSRAQFAELPIIVLTAYCEGLALLAVNAGADVVAPKPVRLDTLFELTTGLLTAH